MTTARSKIAAASLVLSCVSLGAFMPAATHAFFDPTPSAQVAPAPIRLIPVVTHPNGAKAVPPDATLV